MSKLTCILVFAISISNTLVAQESHSKKAAATDSPKSAIGFKQKSSSTPVEGKKSTVKNSNQVTINNHNSTAGKKEMNPAEDAAIVSGIMKTDYANMPADVQSKINNNKAQGKNLLEGVSKVFTVEIKSCLTDADHKKTLLFLKSKKGFINSQFVSAGLVKIIVEPTFDSAELKDAMNAEKIHFNFLNRSYLLKK
ncbi:MAG: hypothetical protein QM737_16300 [Ferruginibacter sp.]